jgi:membrane protein
MLERLRAWADGRRGWGWFVTALDVQLRFNGVQGPQLAAAVTLMAFLSLFPLIALGSAALGFSASDAGITERVIDSFGFPPDGQVAEEIRSAIASARDSRRTATVIGVVGLAWTGLGLAVSVERAIDGVWQAVGRGIRTRLTAALWLGGAAVLLGGSITLSALARVAPEWLQPLTLLVGFGVSFVLWWWTLRALGSRDVGWRPLLPGAIFGAVGLEVLKVLGTWVVPRMVADASATYGSIGVVLALLGWLFVLGRLVVYASALNVVVWERAHGTVTVHVETPRIVVDEGDGDEVGTRAGLPGSRPSVT